MKTTQITEIEFTALKNFAKTLDLTFPLCAVWELKALHYQTIKM